MEHSAGIIIINDSNEVLLLKPSGRYSDQPWSIPKGHVEEGETEAEAATRETEEEAGIIIDDKKIVFLGEKVYRTRKKKISVFLYKQKKDDIFKPVLNWENDKFGWFPIDKAAKKAHESQSFFLKKLIYLMEQ